MAVLPVMAGQGTAAGLADSRGESSTGPGRVVIVSNSINAVSHESTGFGAAVSTGTGDPFGIGFDAGRGLPPPVILPAKAAGNTPKNGRKVVTAVSKLQVCSLGDGLLAFATFPARPRAGAGVPCARTEAGMLPGGAAPGLSSAAALGPAALPATPSRIPAVAGVPGRTPPADGSQRPPGLDRTPPCGMDQR